MKKAILGEGLMNVVSILLLVGILVVFHILFSQNISYDALEGKDRIISSEKVVSDGGITLKNILNTPIENINFYEFILINIDDKEKIKEKSNELLKGICEGDKETLSRNPKEVCFWYLEMKFPDKTVILNGGYDPIISSYGTDIILTSGKEPMVLPIQGLNKEFENKLSYSLILPDYNNNLLEVELRLFKGL
tara:strand:- start:2100 stop:2675 length:576 start_codon:yes stop_codon:yes gene_type:complete